MSLKDSIRKKLFDTTGGQVFFYKFRRIREKFALVTLTDQQYIEKTYKERFGKDIDLVDPKGYGEKLQWMKLFYRNEKMPICSDKYRVREYLKECGLEYLANEVLGVYKDARDIDFDSLPDKFVAKANHGSGWNLICKDKSQLDWKGTVKLMNSWLKLDLSVFGREWNYHEIEPRIVIEKFIEYEPLIDYKIFCFNGEPLYISLNFDEGGKHYIDFYDLLNWEKLPVTYSAFRRSDKIIEKPAQLPEMIEYARTLSKPFPFVRVDFYNYDKEIIFGELTFFPSSGLWQLVPQEAGYEEKLGSLIKLPEPNYNLDLYRKLHEK